MKKQRLKNIIFQELKHFQIETLKVTSSALRRNPLKDPHVRYNVVLVPKKKHRSLPVVFVLSGYGGNAPYYLGPKTMQMNTSQILDSCYGKKLAPKAIYVFVDAINFWGGSQFINSRGSGNYEDYIIKELRSVVEKTYPVSKDAKDWCLMGGSSGGYGALHLGSKYPQYFGLLAAIAPDSFFEMSLLPEVYKALPIIEKLGGLKSIILEHQGGRLVKVSGAHDVLLAVGMTACYSPSKGNKLNWPIDEKTGELKKSVWKMWKRQDPLEFLPKRKSKLKKLDEVFLEVGKFDQYNLQYGARQIHKILKQAKVKVSYSEFMGSHSDIGDRRKNVWAWLARKWK